MTQQVFVNVMDQRTGRVMVWRTSPAMLKKVVLNAAREALAEALFGWLRFGGDGDGN